MHAVVAQLRRKGSKGSPRLFPLPFQKPIFCTTFSLGAAVIKLVCLHADGEVQ